MTAPFASPAGSLPLPTPPYSSSHDSNLLDALIAHYQRERMWVKQTQDVIASARQQQLQPSLAIAPSSSGVTTTPLWQRRKSRRSLRLSDLTQVKLSDRLLSHNSYGTKVLDLFATLLDARIESCKRVESLVSRSAHRKRRSRSLPRY